MNIRTLLPWTLYVLATLLLGYGQMIRKIVSETGGIPSRYGPAVAATVLAVGVVALLLRRPLLSRLFWRITFWLFASTSILAALFGAYLWLVRGLDSPSVYLLLALASYLVPGEIQLYRYAFGCSVPWPKQPESGDPDQQDVVRGV